MDRNAAFARVTGHLRDLHTVRYDRRGYGKSVGLGAPDLQGHVDDLLAVIDGRRSVVVGHSIGGVISLMAAQQSPDVIRAVGAFEPPMPWLDWWSSRSAGSAATRQGDPGAAAEAFLRRMIGDERWEALPPRTRAARRAEGVALLAELASARARPAYDIGAITVPVLIARGGDGAEHHREAARVLAKALGRETICIDGAQHGAHVSHHEEFARFVREVHAAAH